MKTNKFMIGDLVLHDREAYQIRQLGIYGVDRDGEDYPAVCVGKPKCVGLIVERNEIEPIPLTPEILEKNGFRIIFDGELHVSYFQGIESFHTEVKVDKMGIYQKLSMLDGLGNGVTIFECKYIHQLQHALHLCGIEKEIVI